MPLQSGHVSRALSGQLPVCTLKTAPRLRLAHVGRTATSMAPGHFCPSTDSGFIGQHSTTVAVRYGQVVGGPPSAIMNGTAVNILPQKGHDSSLWRRQRTEPPVSGEWDPAGLTRKHLSLRRVAGLGHDAGERGDCATQAYKATQVRTGSLTPPTGHQALTSHGAPNLSSPAGPRVQEAGSETC